MFCFYYCFFFFLTWGSYRIFSHYFFEECLDKIFLVPLVSELLFEVCRKPFFVSHWFEVKESALWCSVPSKY